jgi:steroid 5-alpha reductase family enzyme
MNQPSFWLLMAGKSGVIFVIMTAVGLLSARWKNAGIVDIIWASGFVLLALMDALLTHGDFSHRMILLMMVGLANGRLAWHLFTRFKHEFPKEDARYHQMREQWEREKKPSDWLFYLVFLFQGVLMVLLSLPFTLICLNPNPSLKLFEGVALTIWLIGMVGEFVADTQLKQFKSNPDNKGKICQIGLWNLSRHPNYFFEWLLWCAYCLFALSAPNGLATLYVPALMLFFLIKVTGVAATEAQSLKSRGEDYRRYQQTTSAFIPWFKKKPIESVS